MTKRDPGRPAALSSGSVPEALRTVRPRPKEGASRVGSFPAEGEGWGTCLEVGRHDSPEHLFRRLLSAYLAGADFFEVVERPRLTPASRQVVREFCRRTDRPEVVRDAGSSVRLAQLGDRAFGDVDRVLRRLGEQVVAFHRAAVDSWSRLPVDDDGLWEARDDDIDREAWLLERRLGLERPRSGEDARRLLAAWTVARSLERIADHGITLGKVGPRLAHLGATGGPLRELRQFHQQAMRHLGEALHLADGARANDLLDVGEALMASGCALSEQLLPAVGDGSMSPAVAATVARAFEAIVRTVAYGQDIAQAFLDRPALEPPAALAELSGRAL